MQFNYKNMVFQDEEIEIKSTSLTNWTEGEQVFFEISSTIYVGDRVIVLDARTVVEIVKKLSEASINLATDVIPFDNPKSIYEIQSEAIHRLLNTAGLSIKDVDGLATNGVERFSTVAMSEYLGISPSWTESSFLGGSSYLTFVKRAVDAVESGQCNIAVVSYGSNQKSSKSRSLGGVIENHTPQKLFEYSQGVLSPLSLYALVAQRGFYEWGINSEDLAEIAINSRKMGKAK